MKALIVDDAFAVRRIEGAILRNLGFEVVEAVDGFDALQRMAEHDDLDVILVDRDMPEMDGVDFVRNVRASARGPRVPILMVTADCEPPCIVAALEAGADEYLMKPFDKEMVQQKLHLLKLV